MATELVLPMYPYFSLKNLGKKVSIILSKKQYLFFPLKKVRGWVEKAWKQGAGN